MGKALHNQFKAIVSNFVINRKQGHSNEVIALVCSHEYVTIHHFFSF